MWHEKGLLDIKCRIEPLAQAYYMFNFNAYPSMHLCGMKYLAFKKSEI